MNDMADWKLERHYYPAIIGLDSIDGKNANKPKERVFSLEELRLSFLEPSLRDIRNQLARACGMPERLNGSAKGYEIDESVAAQWKLPPAPAEAIQVGPSGKIAIPEPLDAAMVQNDLQVIVISDDVISRIERLIWEEEYPRHQSDEITNIVIRNPSYRHPNALRRNIILNKRNRLAVRYDIPLRGVHNFDYTKILPWALNRTAGQSFALPCKISLDALKLTQPPGTDAHGSGI